VRKELAHVPELTNTPTLQSILSLACSGTLTLTDPLLRIMPKEFEREILQFKRQGIIHFSGPPVSTADLKEEEPSGIVARLLSMSIGGPKREAPRAEMAFPGRVVALDEIRGMPFLRNVCMSLDNNMRRAARRPDQMQGRFSKAI
jgi:hypothetical protein